MTENVGGLNDSIGRKPWDSSYLKDNQMSPRFQGVTGTYSANIAEVLISKHVIQLMTVIVCATCHNVSKMYVLL